jgi:hypothetical protein
MIIYIICFVYYTTNSTLNKLKEYISVNGITFLSDFDRSINVRKVSKSNYFKMYGIRDNEVRNCIENLNANKIYIVIPFISMNSN